MHRGYWARAAATRALSDAFGEACERNGAFNVVNVGCGYDTLGFYVLERWTNARVVEVDHEEVATERRARGEANARTRRAAASEAYDLRACDVRDGEALRRVFEDLRLDWSAPTLVIAECVLAYLPPGKSDEVVRFFGERVERGAFISYDPIEPDDAFGRQMVRNVESRGCAFAGIRDAPSVAGARARFERNAWRRAEAYDMNEVYARLDPVERARIERIELFDEFEEWKLIMAHYCVSVGVNDDEGGGLADFGLR